MQAVNFKYVHIAIESYNLEIDSLFGNFPPKFDGTISPGDFRGDCSAVKVFIITVIRYLRYFSSHLRNLFFRLPHIFFTVFALLRERAICHK